MAGFTKQTKMEITDFKTGIEDLKNNVIEGFENPLDAFISLHELKAIVDDAMKTISETALQFAETYSEKVIERQSKKIEIMQKSTYSFKHIVRWNDYKKQLSEIEESAKQAYMNLSKGKTIVDDSGEIVEPAQCSVTRYLKITSKKN